MTKNGVYNPFSEPKKEFRASTGDRPLNTEFRKDGPGDIRLDGGSHIIVLKKTTLEAIPARLGALVHDINLKHRDGLGRHGICLGDSGKTNTYWLACADKSPEIMDLTTPQGTMYICAEEQNEDEAFVRLGQAFMLLPVKRILEKHHVNVVVRG